MVQSLTEKIFNTKVELIRELQDLQAQEEDYMMHRQELVQQALAKYHRWTMKISEFVNI